MSKDINKYIDTLPEKHKAPVEKMFKDSLSKQGINYVGRYTKPNQLEGLSKSEKIFRYVSNTLNTFFNRNNHKTWSELNKTVKQHIEDNKKDTEIRKKL